MGRQKMGEAMRILAILLIGFGVSAFSRAQPTIVSAASAMMMRAQVAIPAFHELSPDIYRGARPNLAGIKILNDMGVRTIVDLENDQAVIKAETQTAKSFGIRLISMPMSGFWSPNDKEVDQILRILNESSNWPIYVHCQHGHDRTGLISGLYRIYYQGWAPKRAYREMLDLGFHPQLVFLNHYFEEKTGFED